VGGVLPDMVCCEVPDKLTMLVALRKGALLTKLPLISSVKLAPAMVTVPRC